MITHGIKIISLAIVFFITGAAHAGVRQSDVRWSINPGDEEATPLLGFGWSYAEGNHRWVTELEADIYVDLETPENLTIHIKMAVAYLAWRNQRVGLFINNRYVGEWAGPEDAESHSYEMMIPKRFWQAGTNRITLRSAYTARIGEDRRRLALRVERIELSPL